MLEKSSKMTFEIVKKILAKNRHELQKFDIKELMVFGSVARGDNEIDSDIDFLVSFNQKATFDNLAGLHLFLQDLFKVKIDLVRREIIRKELKDEILKEARVAA